MKKKLLLYVCISVSFGNTYGLSLRLKFYHDTSEEVCQGICSSVATESEILRWLRSKLLPYGWFAKKCIVNSQVDDRTPLYYSCAQGYEQISDYLIEMGAHVDGRPFPAIEIPAQNGFRPLHIAVERGHYSLCNALLNEGSSVHARDPMGQEAIHHACTLKGSVALCSLLINSDSSFLACDQNCNTPLICAIKDKNVATVRLLIERGVLRYAENEYKILAHTFITEEICLLVYRALSLQTLDLDLNLLLREACTHGYPDLCKALIDDNADVNANSLDFDGSLNNAIKNYSNDPRTFKKIILLLLQSGALLGRDNISKKSPLEYSTVGVKL